MIKHFSLQRQRYKRFNLHCENMDKRKFIVRSNAKQGDRGQNFAKWKMGMKDGLRIKRSPTGEDYVGTNYDPVSKKKTEVRHKEVKTGGARLSRVQKKKRKRVKKQGGKYDVERFSGWI